MITGMRFLIPVLFALAVLPCCALNTDKKHVSDKYMFYVQDYFFYLVEDTVLANSVIDSVKYNLNKDKIKYDDNIFNLFKVLKLIHKEKYNEAIQLSRSNSDNLKPDINSSYDALNIYLSSNLMESDAYCRKSEYVNALRILYNLEIEIPDTYKKMLVEVYNNMASIFSEIREKELTEEYLLKSYLISKDTSSDQMLALVRLNLAFCYFNNEKFKESKDILGELTYILNDTDKYYDVIASYYSLKAYNEYNLKEYDKAKEEISKFLTLPIDDPNELSNIYTLKAKIFSKEQIPDSVSFYLNKSLRIVKRLQSDYDLADFYNVCATVYESDKDSVVKYKNLYADLKIKLSDDTNTSEIISLEKRNLIYELEKKFNSRSQSYSINYILSFLPILIFGVYFVKKRKKKTVKSSNIKDIEVYDSLELNVEKSLKFDKVYLDSKITLAKLALSLNTNTAYLSKIINEKYDKNFASLINEYRINEAIKIMQSSDYDKYTIESIANACGFKSLSAFYNAFKQNTGQTPANYIKTVIKK